MTSAEALGGAAGAVVGIGVLLVWFSQPRLRRPSLADRILPYVQDASSVPRMLHRPNRTQSQPQLNAVVRGVGRRIDAVLGGSDSVLTRQARAGDHPDVDAFRAQQVLWGAAGGGLGVALGAGLLVRGNTSPALVAAIVLLAAVSGVLAADAWLTHRAQAREADMLMEFPTIAEMLAMAVAAGEGAVGALDRVCRLSNGELSIELRRCLVDARSGLSLPLALQGLADRTGLISLSRFVDGMVIAVERGTPLANVLRSQAQDVREAGRRDLMETSGRREIYMMVPVVFLILPVTVLFAVFPGFTYLQFSV